jgi:P-type Mg2+ transporter
VNVVPNRYPRFAPFESGTVDTDRPFWLEGASANFSRLKSAPEGLTSAEAKSRLKAYGPNTVAGGVVTGLPRKILRRLLEPLIAILLAAAILSGATGDITGASIILAMVVLSISLDVFQEHKAERAAEMLKRSVALKVDVRRDSRTFEIKSEDVVPGDVVELRAGDLVPADGVVIKSLNAHTIEAILTGEPYPVEKREGPCTEEGAAEAFNAFFSGTSIVSGEASMLVVATGAATRFGAIAASLSGDEPPTAFERGIHRLGILILRLTVFLCLFVLLLNVAFHRPALESFLFAIALAVGLTPELLPMVMTVTLSKGALRMAAKKVVVKRLAAIHDLGALDVLCTDKTGTLTEARIALIGHPDSSGSDSELVLEYAAVNSRFETGIRSPLDQAILAHTAEHALDAWSKLAEVPFDFERRRVSVLAGRNGVPMLIMKGAPEDVLSRCTRYEQPDGNVGTLDAAARQRLGALHDSRASEGQRLLAVAVRDMPSGSKTLKAEDEHELVFAGFCAFVDPPKATAAEAIARLRNAGVTIKVVSGDNELVVRHLVQVLGLGQCRLANGTELAGLSEEAFRVRVDETDLFCRVSPDQKTRIVRALRARGHTVGFLGDGINDAPAIRAADVGLSVDGATDIAREAADMILLAPDLRVLADGIDEGRRTFANILKYVRMGTSSNFGNMLSMALASLWLPFLPLTAVQILLNNLLYDASEVGIPFDDVEPEQLEKPRTWDMKEILRFTLIMGPLSSFFDLMTFWSLRTWLGAGIDEFRTAWFLESMLTQVLVIFVIRSTLPLWRGRPHPVLTTTSLTAVGVAILLAVTPLGRLPGFTPLSATTFWSMLAIVFTYLACAEVLKPYAIRSGSRT